MIYKTEQQIKSLFHAHQLKARELYTGNIKERIKKLDLIFSWLNNTTNQARVQQAIYNDMQRPLVETFGSEIAVILLGIKMLKKELPIWTKPQKVDTPLSLGGAQSYIHYEPKGTSLIIAPWNYPFQLAIVPLCYAIAAGNTAIIKPSEYSKHTSLLLEEMISSLFPEDEVAIVQGEVKETTALLENPFDHIYFTGSPKVGKIIMSAAAKHLSSVTLELGGKSPTIVDESADIRKTAESLLWAKFYNTGQTCIAVDYVLAQRSIMEDLKKEMVKILQKRYGHSEEDMMKTEDLGRIISDRHYQRGIAMLKDAIDKGAKILYGGHSDDGTRFISPTVLTNTNAEMRINQEEIFSPILPILPYVNKEDAVQHIWKHPKPLAMYIYTGNKINAQYFINHTSAGSTVINDGLIQYANENLPFGGVNNSGIGKSHGIHGFLQFTNQRSVMDQKLGLTRMLYPPYTERSEKIIQLLAKF